MLAFRDVSDGIGTQVQRGGAERVLTVKA